MKLPTLPSLNLKRAELVFSAKSFASSMLAVYIAQWVGLPRPFWAMMAAYIVANPMAGAVRSKALFRFCGTLVGCTATLLIVPALSNAPELLALALALWVAVCLYISLLDRTPRSYLFMLAGYTAALIGFPSVETPLQLFDTASARVEEILLGILCASLVHSLVLPTSLAPTVLGLMDRAMGDARHWFADLAQIGRPETQPVTQPLSTDRRRLATDITLLRTLSTHVPFDVSNLRWTSGALGAAQDRLAVMMPTFSGIEEGLQALLEAEGALPADVVQLMSQVRDWLKMPAGSDQAQTQALHQAIRDLDLAPSSVWTQALRTGLAARLDELLQGWQACQQLRRDVDTGLSGSAVPDRGWRNAGGRALHLDHGMAALSALAAFLAIGLSCAFWMLTGWPMGSAAAMMAAIFCCFFASVDDPVPMIHGFLKFTLWSVPISAIYVLVLLPMVVDMSTLVLLSAPFFLVIGVYIARPATAGAAMAMMMGVAGALSAHDTASADLVSFINSMTGQVLGIVMAARMTGLIRSVGTDWMARRIQRSTWRELAQLAAGRLDVTRGDAHVARTVDRIGLLAQRMAQSTQALPSTDALHELRMSADITALRRAQSTLPQAPAQAITAVLTDIATLFRQRLRNPADDRPASLLHQLDSALSLVMALPNAKPDHRPTVAALVGLRRNLFRHAPAPLTSPQTETTP